MSLRRQRTVDTGGTAVAEATASSAGGGQLGSSGRMASLGEAFAKWLAALSLREQIGVAASAVVLLLALVIGLGVLPAWRSLQQGPARQQALNGQMMRMAQLEAQALALKDRPRWSAAQAGSKLQATSAGLAAEALQLSLSDQQADVTLRAMPADTLAAWLTAAREQAHAVPVQAQLTREASTPEGADRWSGSLVLRLPP